MNEIRRSQRRGLPIRWLKSFHTFSFANYFRPEGVEFGPLRVINEDRVQPGAGFGTHAHRDMEIISYVLSGELALRIPWALDSFIGGSVQHCDCRKRRVRHSEFNPSPSKGTHFLQIWINPSGQIWSRL